MIPDIVMTLDQMQSKIDYYEALLDYLDDMVPCLGELIEQFKEGG